MATLKFIVGVIGNFISVSVMLSPTKTFYQIVKRGSTENFEGLPYVCAVVGLSLWFYYAVSKTGEFLLATTNGLGAITFLVYVVLFLIYAPPEIRAKTAILVGILNVGFPTVVILATRLMMHGDLAINVLGFVCATLSVLMYASPLVAMKRVVTTKSVEYMPFLLTLFLFLNGGIWTTYAILGTDYFLGVPNAMGFFLGAAQMVLYAIYWKSKPSQYSSDELDEECQRNHLIHESSED